MTIYHDGAALVRETAASRLCSPPPSISSEKRHGSAAAAIPTMSSVTLP